jgi:nucleoside-diphosphate-sugar epimerase
MNILITGITGLFGSELAKAFAPMGNLHGLSRASSSKSLLDQAGLTIQWHEGDVLDFNSLLDALLGIDLVIHAAGKVSFLFKDENQLFAVNHQGTANLVNAMLAIGTQKLVHVSSVAALGQVPGQEVYDEKATWVDAPNQSAYALSKYWGELEVWRGEQEGLDVLIINPSVLLGKASYEKSSGAVYGYVKQGNPFFPKGNINYLDVRDAATITRALVEKNAWGERFILSKESRSYQDFFHQVSQAFGVAGPTKSLPNWVIAIGFPVLRLLSLLGLVTAPIHQQVARNAQRMISYRNRKVQDLLGFHYRDLKDTLDWAKST